MVCLRLNSAGVGGFHSSTLLCSGGEDAKTVPYAWGSSLVLSVVFDADCKAASVRSQLDSDLPENCIMGHENEGLFCPLNCLIKALYSNCI